MTTTTKAPTPDTLAAAIEILHRLDPSDREEAIRRIRGPGAREEMAEALADMIDLAVWMSGSGDFGPGGLAEVGWRDGRNRIGMAQAVLARSSAPREAPDARELAEALETLAVQFDSVGSYATPGAGPREEATCRTFVHCAQRIRDALSRSQPSRDDAGESDPCSCRKAVPGMWTSGYDETVRSFVRHGAEKCEEFVPRASRDEGTSASPPLSSSAPDPTNAAGRK